MTSFPVFAPTLEIFSKLAADYKEISSQTPIMLAKETELANLVNCAFWASLLQEEGREVSISLCLISPDVATKSISLERELPFTPESLRKLSPALVSPSNYIGISKSASGSLWIWGIGRFPPENSVRLEARRAGQVSIKIGFDNAAIFYPGAEPRYLGGQGMARFNSLMTLVLNVSDPDEADLNRSALLGELVNRMRRHGRGGTILLLPDFANLNWEVSIAQPIPYRAKADQPSIAEISGQTIRTWNTVSENESDNAKRRAHFVQLSQNLDVELDAVAGMTAVDGAVLLNTNLKLLGFGAKITAGQQPSGPPNILVWELAHESKEFSMAFEKIGGTRHQSAAKFVAQHNLCGAIVASQDGRLSVMFSRDENQVTIVRANALLD